LSGSTPQPSQTPPEIASAVPAVPTSRIASNALDPVPGTTSDVQVATLPPPTVPTADAAVPTQPTGVVTMVQVPVATHLYVQAGAFGSYQNALRLQARLGSGLKISSTSQNGHTLYRVRLGPFDELGDADRALARLSGLGSNDVRIVVDQ
jgi:rare lipoprotein A